MEQEQDNQQQTQVSVGRSAAMMSVLVILSRITGFFRTWAQAYALGTTLLASCYTVANNLPNQLYELVIGGMIMTAFLPVYLSVKQKSGQKGENENVSNLLSIVCVLMSALTVLCIVFAAQLVFIQSAGTDQTQMSNAVILLRFFAVEILFYFLSSIASGILNAERDYLWSTAAPIFNNFITITSFLLFAAFEKSDAPLAFLLLALGNPLGVLVQVLMQLPSLGRHGVKISWKINFHDPALKETLRIGLPTLVVTICSFVTVSVMNSYALVAIPDQGSSIQYYARLWYTLPYAVLSVPITTAMFTELSDMFAKHDMAGYVHGFTNGACQILFTLIPFMLYLIVFARPLMELLRLGRFDEQSAELTAYYLRFLALALPWYGLSTFFQKVFSSMRHMMVFTAANVVASVIQVVYTMVFTGTQGIAAVALGSVLFFLVVDGVSFALLKRILKHIGLRAIGAACLRGLLLGCVGAGAGGALIWVFERLFGSLGGSILQTIACVLIAGIASVASTYGLAIALRVPESAFMRRLLGRLVRHVD